MSLYARIETLTEQIDVREQRLNRLAISYGVPVPPAPTGQEVKKPAFRTPVEVSQTLHRSGQRFLRSLRFEAFLRS